MVKSKKPVYTSRINDYLHKHKDRSPLEALQHDCKESLAYISLIQSEGKVEANRLKAASFLVEKLMGSRHVIDAPQLVNLEELASALYGLNPKKKDKRSL